MSTPQVITARIRGFICTNAHPTGCAENVRRQIEVARAPGAGAGAPGWKDVLVIGSSTGYGLASLIAGVFGHGARGFGVCLERAAHGDKPGSAGFYNLAEVHRRARAEGIAVDTVIGDAFTSEVKAETVARLARAGAKLGLVVYSLAAPRRTDPASGVSYTSALKPLGAPYTSKSVNLGNDQVVEVQIPPGTDAEVDATTKVMGGEDWALWMRALADAGVIGDGCRTVAYSYIGPELTYPIYRSGTIGKAKEHLEATARALDADLGARVGGAAYVSVNKALVTQASSAIPVVPLYMSILFKVMKERGTHEGTIEQIVRLYRDHLAPGRAPRLDDGGRIRIDDLEMDPAVQAEVRRIWSDVTTDTLFTLSDYAAWKREFRNLFGFDVPGVDYTIPVDVTAELV